MEDQNLAEQSKKEVAKTNLGRGHEEPSTQEDLMIPRAQLVQSTSDVHTREENPLPLGKLINSITEEELPSEFVPVFKFTNWTRWNPRKKEDPNFDPAFDAGAMIFSTSDPNDPRVLEGKDFGPNGEPPAVTKYINFLALFPGHSMPIIVSFAKSSFNTGKKLNTLTQFAGGDMFNMKYKLLSSKKEKDGTKFSVLEVVQAGKVSEEEFKAAEMFYNQFRGATLKVHQEEPDWDENKK